MQKKRCLVMISTCAGLCVAAQMAHAQSSVTLYGVVDAGFTFTNNQNGNKAYQATPGNLMGSRWGLLGSEDLGGGTKAIFKLENGFNNYTGALAQGGRLFGRTAYVGMTNSQYGTFTMGRQYNSVQDYLSRVAANGTSDLPQYANAVYDNDGINNTWRTDNSVKYVSPTFSGLTGQAMYGFSNTAGQFANNRMWSAGLNYVHGPIELDAAYVLANNPGSNTVGAAPSDNFYNTGTSIISNVKRNQVFGGGAQYSWGLSVVALLYTNSKFDLNTGGSLHFANYEAKARYYVTPAAYLAAGYMYTTLDSTSATAANSHFHQISVGGDYFLSKRTDLYLAAFYQHASGSNAWIEGISAPSSNHSQFVGVGGLRVKF
ncbi:porin [Paraburkholderia fynbosensis]|uniref:Outer membrane porin protein n=1 Tax=Paraburkholderia fynbosensis TaxID=1200993 RepID=A0A6J5H299_9BURK|nr:porin [Paraburkholderia fynbosensis]CAB3810440.1 Outer membrane porin protein [Paraburkholderia fynbosensis]